MEYIDVLSQAQALWGRKNREDKLIEEAGEFFQAANKYRYNKSQENYAHMIEEAVDLGILVDSVKLCVTGILFENSCPCSIQPLSHSDLVVEAVSRLIPLMLSCREHPGNDTALSVSLGHLGYIIDAFNNQVIAEGGYDILKHYQESKLSKLRSKISQRNPS